MDMRSVRNDLGLTQAQLAKELGWSVRQVSHIENGTRTLQKQTELALKYLLITHGKLSN